MLYLVYSTFHGISNLAHNTQMLIIRLISKVVDNYFAAIFKSASLMLL